MRYSKEDVGLEGPPKIMPNKTPPLIAIRWKERKSSPADEGFLEDEAEQLLHLAGLLGQRDLATLSCIIKRIGEICASDGEETALAVLDQIEAIFRNQSPDA